MKKPSLPQQPQLGFGFGPAVATSTSPAPRPPVEILPANSRLETPEDDPLYDPFEIQIVEDAPKRELRTAKHVKKVKRRAWFGPYELQEEGCAFSQNYLVLPFTRFSSRLSYDKVTGKRVYHVPQTRLLVKVYVALRECKELPLMDVTVPSVVGQIGKYGPFRGDSEVFFVIDIDKDPCAYDTMRAYEEILKEFDTEAWLAVGAYLEGRRSWDMIVGCLPPY